EYRTDSTDVRKFFTSFQILGLKDGGDLKEKWPPDKEKWPPDKQGGPPPDPLDPESLPPHLVNTLEVARWAQAGAVIDVAFTKDAKRLATAGEENPYVRFWDRQQERQTGELRAIQPPVTAMAAASQANRVVVCAAGNVKVFTADTEQ